MYYLFFIQKGMFGGVTNPSVIHIRFMLLMWKEEQFRGGPTGTG